MIHHMYDVQCGYDSLTRWADATDGVRTRPSYVRKTKNTVAKPNVSEEVSQTETLVWRITTKHL